MNKLQNSHAILPTRAMIREQVNAALQEDIGSGDLTGQLINSSAQTRAKLISRQAAVLCGRVWFTETFYQVDNSLKINWHKQDGEILNENEIVCEIHGAAKSIVAAERTAINFLQTLSGTATITRKYVDAVTTTRVKILDTRKTIPLLRAAQKYATAIGGAYNHRHGLYDQILIKENHIAAAGSVSAAIKQMKLNLPTNKFISVEVESISQLPEALAAGANRILLDNFSLPDIKSCVEIVNGRVELEVSGNIDIDTVNQIAKTGVDYISIGGLTKHIQSIDFSLRC